MSARGKFELAADRELEKLARARHKLERVNRKHAVATRQIDEAERRARYFQARVRDLDACETAAESLP